MRKHILFTLALVVVAFVANATNGSISGPTSVCPGDTDVTYYATGSGGGIGNGRTAWRLNGQPIFGNAYSADVDFPTAGTYTLTAINVAAGINASLTIVAGSSNPGSLALSSGTCNAGNVTLDASGYSGNLRWQRRVGTGNWADYAPGFIEPLGETLLTVGTQYQYRVRTNDNTCAVQYSNVVTFTPKNPVNGGSVSGSHHVCYGSSPSQNLTGSGVSGGAGSYQFSWFKRVSGGGWQEIFGGETLTPIEIGNLTQTTEFKREVTDSECGSDDSNNTVTITVDPLTNAGSISGASNQCSSGSQTYTLSGYTGTIQRWQYQTKDGSNNWSGWNTITETDNVTSVSPTLNYWSGGQRTYNIRATIKSGVCATLYAYKQTTVDPPTVAGTISGNSTKCGSGTENYTLSGHRGTIQRWEYRSKDGGGSWSGWSLITETDDVTSVSPSLGWWSGGTRTYEVRATIKSGSCTTLYADKQTTVDQPTDGGLITGTTEEYGIASGSVSINSYVGDIIRWESQTTGGWQPITHTSATLTYTNIQETTKYRAVVQNGSCGIDYSGEATLTILDLPTVDLGIQASIRPDGGTTISTDNSHASYQWLKNEVAISGATSNELVVNEPGTYKVTVTSSGGATYTTGDAIVSNQLEANENMVTTYTYRVATTTADDPFAFTTEQQSVSTQVYDGLGRPIQQVGLNASPQKEDLVVPVEYDDYGRQTKSYLPYVASPINSAFKSNALANDYALSDHRGYYVNTSSHATDKAFSEVALEASPLNRPLEQGAPGSPWQLGQNTIKFQYAIADSAEVIDWTFESMLTDSKAVYPDGQLYENTTEDEDGNQTVEYTDKQGQTILKKSQVDGSTWAETYYIYDVYGRLSAVLPPEATSQINTGFFGQNTQTRTAFLNTWAFLYDYDGRDRMTMKKVPGADSVFMVYDRWDRLVLTQDGNQRTTNSWLFTKYDQLNRPIITGIMTGGTESAERTAVAASTVRFDTLNTSLTNEYSNQSYPTSGIDNYLTVTYYDNYDWDNSGVAYTNPAGLTQHTEVKGLVTGTLTKTGNGSWITSASYYDDRYRVIQTVSTNHLGGTDVVTNHYDFIGQITKSTNSHSDGSNAIEITRTFAYDHAGRLLKTYHELKEYIQWTDLVGVVANGNEITKTEANGWGTGGAASEQVLAQGKDGKIEFYVAGNDAVMMGFSEINEDAHYNTIDYSIYTNWDWNLQVYENGTLKGNMATYAPGDIISVERESGLIKYKKNDTLIYTSTISSSQPLFCDVALFGSGNKIMRGKVTYNEIMLSENSYNELGELIEKDLHGETGGNFAQSLDYTYNIRGWLTSINKADLSGGDNDLFGMELLYDTQDGSLSNTQLYNGNISAMMWSNHDAAAGLVDERAYKFGYDRLNRLKTASHYQDNAATNKYGVQGLNYDLNGNIESLQRRAQSTTAFMDDLTYTYAGNQLQKVSDAATDTTGFYDGYTGSIDYVYDANGNMVKDRNKGIDSIYYNHLNLPTAVILSASGGSQDSIKYLYDAAGIKLQQKVWKDDTLQKTTDYVGEFIYENGELQLIQHEEGRMVPITSGLVPTDSTGIELSLTLNGNALDSSGKGRHGTVNGASSATGHDNKPNSAYSFDGVDDYIDLSTHASSITSLTEGTLSIWFKTSSTAKQMIVGVGDLAANYFSIAIGGDMTGSFTDESMQVVLNIDGTLTIVGCIRKGTNYYNDGQWHHLAYVVNSTSNKLFVDGIEESVSYQFGTSGSVGNHFMDVNASGFGIGRRFYPSSPGYFNGSLDEFNVFSRALSATEISGLANGYRPGENTIEGYDYQYHLKDHLGNVRMTFSTTPENYTMVETFETGEENGWEDLHRFTSTNANTTVGGNEVERLQSGQTGAMLFLEVNKGDTLDLSVNANYESAPTNNNFSGTVYGALFNAFDNVYGGGAENGVAATSTVFDDALSGTDMAGKGSTSSAPRAFLNYIIFDKEMTYKTAGFQQISTAALGIGVHETISINDILPEQDGYILAYLSNENQEVVNIHWDDFTVYHGKTNVVSTQDYYPFGLTFNESVRVASMPNRFKYNSFEYMSDLNLNLYDYQARYYDPAIGRFIQVDPKADLMRRHSTYNYAYDNPIRYIDPDGMMPTEIFDGSQEKDDQQQEQETQKKEQEPDLNFLQRAAFSFLSTMNMLGGQLPGGDERSTEENINEGVQFTVGIGLEVVGANMVLDDAINSGTTGAVDDLASKGDDVAKVADNVIAVADDVPSEPYNRRQHYGNTPTRSDRNHFGAGEGEVIDHKRELVRHYYEGDGNGGIPGFRMTESQRREFAKDRSNMQVQSATESASQGGRMSGYSKQKRKEYNFRGQKRKGG